ncbi:rho GTPase-activating protein 33-like isoform X2 [Stegostoma tigrinum]|uniref:rho GTPase-activating protein 33-like isoform X2 n=1 Tax=Stegostoma tigrinum TaxID=3053191 RepID=UPI00286FBA1A|nr:rho GTPase-activating protein 33-like isoform X2 [Stegostoma tigrinum]
MENASLWRRSLMDIFSKEEASLSVARSMDNLDAPGDLPRSQTRGKSVKRPSIVKGHFPKLADCAHFHYEYVDLQNIQLALASQPADTSRNGLTLRESIFLVQVVSQGRGWLVRRSYEDFQTLDSLLHQCIYDRRFSQLPELPPIHTLNDDAEIIHNVLMDYLGRFTSIADNKINCGPILTWMEIDNKGNRLLVNDEAVINVPAIAAAQVIKRYIAQASDELSFEVGDIVSVLDMPAKEDTSWWRGKHAFQVGFFPSECVQLICEKLNPSNSPGALKAVCKKRGKLMGLLRNFIKSRPSRQKLKQRGILKERVFGCDLGEHLLNSGLDVPQVLKSCSEFIEEFGIVDGIYRVSGISSNIQKLRHQFDSDQIPDLRKGIYLQDIHCVSSLCKLYFRELPNPLLTYQLYDPFADAVCSQTVDERLQNVHNVIQQLPPPHYRTLHFLMAHLNRLAKHSAATNMHIKNLAIVWAPNLLRSKEIESVGFMGTDAFQEVRIQSIVVEFLLRHVDILFSDTFSSAGKENSGHNDLIQPKSTVKTPVSSRLLSLEEAQARSLTQGDEGSVPVYEQLRPLNTGMERSRGGGKIRKPGASSWKSFFTTGKVSVLSRRKSQPEMFKITKTGTGSQGETVTLRSVKSEESLTSQHSATGPLRCANFRVYQVSGEEIPVSEPVVGSEDPDDIYALPDPEQGVTGSNPSPELCPNSPDISSPVSISVPAEVLQMLGSWAGEPPASTWSSGQTISLLLESRQLHSADNAEKETGPNLEERGDRAGQELLRMLDDQPVIYYQTMASVAMPTSCHLPPPPPLKNAARLMSLKLMEQAHQVYLQSEPVSEQSLLHDRGTGPGTDSHQEQDEARALYTTVHAIRKAVIPNLSPCHTNVSNGGQHNQLTTQELRTLAGPPVDVCRSGSVRLTQSVRGPIAHCRVEESVPLLCATSRSYCPSGLTSTSCHRPLDFAPFPSDRARRQLALETPQADPCPRGSLRQLKLEGSLPQNRVPHRRCPSDHQHRRCPPSAVLPEHPTPGSSPPGTEEEGNGSDVYAEIAPDPGHCRPHEGVVHAPFLLLPPGCVRASAPGVPVPRWPLTLPSHSCFAFPRCPIPHCPPNPEPTYANVGPPHFTPEIPVPRPLPSAECACCHSREDPLPSRGLRPVVDIPGGEPSLSAYARSRSEPAVRVPPPPGTAPNPHAHSEYLPPNPYPPGYNRGLGRFRGDPQRLRRCQGPPGVLSPPPSGRLQGLGYRPPRDSVSPRHLIRNALSHRPGTVLLSGRYANLPLSAPPHLSLYRSCRGGSQRQAERPPPWGHRGDEAERSFC